VDEARAQVRMTAKERGGRLAVFSLAVKDEKKRERASLYDDAQSFRYHLPLP